MRSLSTAIGWLAGATVVAMLMLAPLSVHLSTSLPDDGDSLQNLWILWWGATHLGDGYPEVLEANNYYPHPSALLYSEPQFAGAAVARVLLGLSENRVLMYNLLGLIGLVLSCTFTAALAYQLTGDRMAAFIAGCVYAFSSYHLSHLPRSQLIQAQWIPAGILCLHCFARTKKWGYAFGFGLSSLLVGLSSFYYLVFYLVAVAVLTPAYVVASALRIRDWIVFFVPAFASGLVFLGLALAYLNLFERYGFTGISANLDLVEFFVPPHGNPIYGAIAPPLRPVDHFLGYASLIIAGCGVVSLWRDRHRLAGGGDGLRHGPVWLGLALTGTASLFFAAGPDLLIAGHWVADGPFRLLQWLPPFEKLREPSRFAILVYLCLALFVARGAQAILDRPRRFRTLLGAALCVVILAEQMAPARTTGVEVPTGDGIPAVYEWLAENPPPGPVVELPVWPFARVRNTAAEAYFSTIHQRPVPFGKPSFYPPAFELLQWELRDFPDDRSIYLLSELGFELAVVHPKRWVSNREFHLRRLEAQSDRLPRLASFPDIASPLGEHYRLGDERIHWIAGSGALAPPPECDCALVPADQLSVKANGVNDAALAVDGDPRTRWTTGAMQQEGHYFEIVFPRRVEPARIEIDMVFPFGEFARNLEFNGFRGQRAFRFEQIEDLDYKVRLIDRLIEDPNGASLRYDLVPMPVDRMRLFIHRTEQATIGWSIPEIRVYVRRSAPETERAAQDPSSSGSVGSPDDRRSEP